MKKKSFFLLLLLIITLNLCSQQKNNQDSALKLLNEANIQAQTNNQLAQAEYYSKQPSSTNNQWISVLGVFVAGIISILGTVILSVRTLKNEKAKSLEIQKKEYATATRLAAANLMSKVAKAAHSMTWVLWIAKNTSQLLDIKHVQEHDRRMNKIYSEIVEAQVNLAAYNKSLYSATEELVDKLYKFDANIGRISPDLLDQEKKETATIALGQLWEPIYLFSLEIPRELSNKLELIIEKS